MHHGKKKRKKKQQAVFQPKIQHYIALDNEHMSCTSIKLTAILIMMSKERNNPCLIYKYSFRKCQY